MSAGPLTREMVQRAFDQMKSAMRAPVEPTLWITHPRESWWIVLHGAEGWKWRRLKAFRQFWRYRRYFDDDQVMIVLSSIIRGEYP